MKRLIVILAGLTANLAFAANVEAGSNPDKPVVACVSATVRERREAMRYGYTVENWCALTKKARREIRQAARAKQLGMTVAEMKAEANRRAAEKAGCPADQWAKMNVRERCAFRRQAKSKQD